jgi:hypothetical protein
VTVEPTVELFQPSTGDGTVETVEFVLHNRSDDTFGLNPYAWTIHRRTEGGWERVAPDATPEPWLGIHGGGTYRWVLAVETHPSPQGDERMDIVQDLDDGTYAFAVDGTFGDGPNSGTRVECVALFEVRRGN